uniref:hypothetical protein n=2 Tax=Flavobacterium sp. TaxID=239 RepID=UPI004048EE40
MNTDQGKTKKQIINYLKKKFPMEVSKGVRFDLQQYSIIEKGKFLENIYTWKLTEFDFETYFLSIRNSYKIEICGTTSQSWITTDQESFHNALVIKTDFQIPELIIRPAYLREKIANLFLNFDIKLMNRKVFNEKYILESSSDIKVLEQLLNQTVTNELIKHMQFSLQFKNKNILLKFEKTFNEQDSINLIVIGKILESELKTWFKNRYD